MLTVAPHLHVRHPSPTTIEFTISTAPRPTLPLRLLIALTYILRIVLGLSILLFLYSKYLLSPYADSLSAYSPKPDFFSNAFIWHTLYLITTSSFGEQCRNLASSTSLTILLPTSLLALYILSLHLHTTETLLVLRGLGIQTSSSSDTFWGGSTTRFIPTEKIQDMFINEAFKGFEVRYYLVVVVEGESEIVVVFPRLLPRIELLEKVWRGGRRCLWEKEKGSGAGKDESSRKGG